jgi:hypothetical protein
MFTCLAARFRAARAGDGGYSLAEVTVAATIMGALAVIMSVAIGAAMRVSATFDHRAVDAVSVSRMLDGLTGNIVLADPIENVSGDMLVMQVQRGGTCERHTYYVMRNATGPYSLSHKVQEIPVNAGATCADLDPSVWTRTGLSDIGRYRTDRLELEGMTASPTSTPIFTYYSVGGARMRVPGDAGYTPLTDLAGACQVARVSVTLPIAQPDGTVHVISTDAAPRAASLGRRC